MFIFVCLQYEIDDDCYFDIVRASRLATSRQVVSRAVAVRWMSGDDKHEKKSRGLFGVESILGESDELIKTEKDRLVRPNTMPDYVPPDVQKDMKELGLDGLEDLEELEAQTPLDGWTDLGLVPPEGSGTFASPILIPTRKPNRVVGYTDPASHAMYYFTIHNDDNLYYIKDLGLFFKCLPIPDEEAAHAHH